MVVRATARLLLVEDDVTGRSNAAEYLRASGYEVLEAEDGPAAVRRFHENPDFDLLITDVGLPNGINGRQLADLIRERSPAMPVLFITGNAGPVHHRLRRSCSSPATPAPPAWMGWRPALRS